MALLGSPRHATPLTGGQPVAGSPVRDGFDARLRRAETEASVKGSTPVLFFGDIFSARVATVGLNPSDQEFLDRNGEPLPESKRRFETLASLNAQSRGSLTDEQCERSIQTMRDYFTEGKPVYGWFRALERVCQGFGVSQSGGSAVHLDLFQEATTKVWSDLDPADRQPLLDQDLPFLKWQLQAFPFDAVLCTSKSVSNHVRALFSVKEVETGQLAKMRWWIGRADVGARTLAFAGWNLPLARATGLGAEGEVALGQLLSERLEMPGSTSSVAGEFRKLSRAASSQGFSGPDLDPISSAQR